MSAQQIEADAMPVYMVYICHSVSDRAQLEKYWASIGPTLEGHSVKFLAGYTPFEVLEGEHVLGVFVAEVAVHGGGEGLVRQPRLQGHSSPPYGQRQVHGRACWIRPDATRREVAQQDSLRGGHGSAQEKVQLYRNGEEIHE